MDQAKLHHTTRTYPGFYSVNQLGYFYYSLDDEMPIITGLNPST